MPMSSQPLFDRSEFVPSEVPPREERPAGNPRLRRASRDQIIMHCQALDDLIPEDHVARSIWAYVGVLDLSVLLEQIKAVEGHEGRAMTDPRILLTLWLYATVNGIGSARELARLCEAHAAYKWIAGGVSLNAHTLADFRANQGKFLDKLLTQSVASLMYAGVVDIKRVAQDGMRVRAHAGGKTFRRRPTLENCLSEAQDQVRRLRTELDSDPAACHNRVQAARLQAAQEREAHVAQALEELKKIEAKKPAQDRDRARASTTDPEARFMKMADGGFRPAYNMQYATDTKTQVIVGVQITNVGSDKGELVPMHKQIRERYGRVPEEQLADGDFAVGADIESLAAAGTVVYTPPRKPRDSKQVADVPRPGESEVLTEWRLRMKTDTAKQTYRERASTAECVNAQARNRGLRQFPVRGKTKALAVALWYAVAHNVMRTIQLCPELLRT
jgi:transposase